MKQRIVTGVAAGVLFVGAVFVGGWFYVGLLVLMAIVGYSEFVRLNTISRLHPAALLGYAFILFVGLPWSDWGMTLPTDKTVIWLLVFGLLTVTVLTKNKLAIDGAAALLLGALYIGYGFAAMIEIRFIEQNGLFWTALLYASIWASDIGAYFIGKSFGRHKLIPQISPNKTIEGAIGGVLTAILAAVIFAILFPDILSVPLALLIGLIAAVAGQLGDLIQSAYKRVKNVKDTGVILPGHGGMLDRVDSWLIVFPLILSIGLIVV